MSHQKLNALIFTNVFVLMVFAIFMILSFKSENHSRTVYINNVKLFNEFNMSRDLNSINMAKINGQKKKLDSLYGLYNIYNQSNRSEESNGFEQQLRAEDEKLKDMVESLNHDLNQKVWKRLNQYIKQYGDDNDYDIIMGTQGNGNVMYAKDWVDVTTALIEYSNAKYEGSYASPNPTRLN